MEELEVYTLEHTYSVNEIYKTSKLIGLFSSWEEADKVIDQFIQLPGFREYPRSCFIITKHIVDDFDKWKDGFTDDQLELLY